jgi:hypothetical protein
MKNPDLPGDAVMNNYQTEKFELIYCPHDCENLKLFLFEINRLFYESEQYQIEKEYQFSIMSLKMAFEKTWELILPMEQQCADIFRLTIIESLENIRKELRRMTKGFFRSRHFERSLLMSEEILREFKEILASVEESKIQDSVAPSKDKQINLPAV